MTNNREALLDKIRALLNKTQAQGCTEHEEMLALDKARAMMDAYEVTEEDLKLTKQEAAIIREAPNPRDKYGIRRELSDKIAEFCDCKYWLRRAKGEKIYKIVCFAGLPSDVAFAEYLLDHLQHFVQEQLVEHMITDLSGGDRRAKNRDFVKGCCSRIGERMHKGVEKSKAVATSNSKALVVIKTHAIDEVMKAEGIRLGRGLSTRSPDYGSASYAAGRAAGDRATFGRPVSHGSVPKISKG